MFEFQTIGVVHSCYKEKFGIPRQPGLVPDARGTIELLPPYDNEDAFRCLEGFSHIWVLFVFHACPTKRWKATVRPPRLGGAKKIGVFATRSNFRPNPVGMSVVALEGVERKNGKLQLNLKGIDILDRTPVIDIKPYLPYSDAVMDARGGFAAEMPGGELEVVFDAEADLACRLYEEKEGYPLSELIVQTLGQDPRPRHSIKKANKTKFAMKLLDLDIKWEVVGNKAVVRSVDEVILDKA